MALGLVGFLHEMVALLAPNHPKAFSETFISFCVSSPCGPYVVHGKSQVGLHTGHPESSKKKLFLIVPVPGLRTLMVVFVF